MEYSDPTTRQLFELIDAMPGADRVRLLEELMERQKASRRKHLRKGCTDSVHYSDGEHFFKDMAKNISEGGVMISTKRAFAVGQILSVVIPLGDHGESFKFKGKVVWAKNDGIGVKFFGNPVSLTRRLKF